MKKFLSVIFAVLLITALSAVAGCEYSQTRLEWRLSFDIIDYEENDYAPKYLDEEHYSEVYRLSAGKQYYLRVYNYSILLRGTSVEKHEEDGQYIRYKNCFIYDDEEVEISNDTDNVYKAFPVKGLKAGSAIIQYDASGEDELVLMENYLKILIIFE